MESGKHYFEATVTDEGLCRVGWSTAKATLELGRLWLLSLQGSYPLIRQARIGMDMALVELLRSPMLVSLMIMER